MRSADSMLDLEVVTDALSLAARTPMGAAAARALGALTLPEILRAHVMVEELRAIEAVGGPIPVGAVTDIRDAALRAEKGAALDDPSLREAGRTLAALCDLSNRLREELLAPLLSELGARIDIDQGVASDLDESYDATGQISGAKYPDIGALRAAVTSLHESVRRTAEEVVRGDEYADILQDRYVTMRDDRYVVPVKSHAKRWDIGIVHGSSGSGKTVYVEPTEVVQLNNRLRMAEAELEEACHRVRTMLSSMLGRIASAVARALDAVVEIDLACARERLAERLSATRPIVREDGVVDLRDARHPVLVLRGVPVVANRLRLDAESSVLVLTGPNTGGKTVALKTIGLCAELVRRGCFVPATEGSRVDRFEVVLADIGDAQSIQGDLSSFSAHLVVLRSMLEVAPRHGPRALCLLDEPCAGTDPSQGGALARALLEALRDAHTRVVATTHFAQLKGLAEADSRFRLAAMEYADGRPTYRVLDGAAGESHALDTALRMGIPEPLVTRARGLLSESERGLQDALASLEAARDVAVAEAARLRIAESTVRAREAGLDARAHALDAQKAALEEREGSRFVERIRAAEKAIAAVVADLQRAPDSRRAESARQTVQALSALVASSSAPVEARPVAEGDHVKVRSLGQNGEVVHVSGDQVSVRVRGVVLKVRAADLVAAQAPERTIAAPSARSTGRSAPAAALRVAGNTLDLRGERVEEALDRVDKFLAEAPLRGHDVVFLLHGHGTGALKDALRKELRRHPNVKHLEPADADQGGDAFTVIWGQDP